MNAGSSDRPPTLSRIWSEASATRRARERRIVERVVIDSTGRLANRWRENDWSSSWLFFSGGG